MSKILWACWDGGGNLPPSLGIGRALRDRGHSVVFAGRPEMVGRVRAAGLGARELTQAYALIDRFAWHPLARVFGYLGSPAVGDELVSVVRAEAPDVVAIDAMFGAALGAAPQFNAPTAVVVHTFVRRMYDAWKGNLMRQSDGRAQSGFAKLPPIEELWGARDLVHANTLAELDAPPAKTPLANLGHGAPVLLEESRAVMPRLPWPESDPAPLVLLSFSTVLEQRSPAMLQRALDALGTLPVHVVATTGDVVDPADLTAPPNAAVLRYASHDALMPRAALVVTHGGHGTAMRALRHGLPMVLTPALADDQPFVGAAVQEWGAGRALGKDPAADEIATAARAVLENPACRDAAKRLAPLLADVDGAAAAAAAIERLAPSVKTKARNRTGAR
ncbi:MAG: hypothetical protein KGL11_02960 [Alphaproteobacteria bacterium]|nr:hypothetical protein [Alphaproteobacteria bacterium]